MHLQSPLSLRHSRFLLSSILCYLSLSLPWSHYIFFFRVTRYLCLPPHHHTHTHTNSHLPYCCRCHPVPHSPSFTRVCVCVCVCVCAYMRRCLMDCHTYVTYRRSHTYACMRTHTHTHMCKLIYIYIQAV